MTKVSLDQAIGRLAAAGGPHALRQGQLAAAAGQPDTRARDALATFVDNSRYASPGRPRSTASPLALHRSS